MFGRMMSLLLDKYHNVGGSW